MATSFSLGYNKINVTENITYSRWLRPRPYTVESGLMKVVTIVSRWPKYSAEVQHATQRPQVYGAPPFSATYLVDYYHDWMEQILREQPDVDAVEVEWQGRCGVGL